MNLQLIRNATLKITYGGQRLLIDPYLAEQEAYPGFEGTVNSEQRHPIVPLSTALQDIIDVDGVIVTHTHSDHWDEAAIRYLPKHLPIWVQHEEDRTLILQQGFQDVRVLHKHSQFHGIALHRTPGQHGSDEVIHRFGDVIGEVMGVVLESPHEKTLYIAGDTVWNEKVQQTLCRYQPDIIVLNTGDARLPVYGSITMNADDVQKVAEYTPDTTLIAVHLEAVNHATLTRQALQKAAEEQGFSERLYIPKDGQAYSL